MELTLSDDGHCQNVPKESLKLSEIVVLFNIGSHPKCSKQGN